MKKFKFKFETILKIRSHNVKLAEEDLARVLKEKHKRYDKISDFEEEIASLLYFNKNEISFLQARNYRINHIQEQIKKLLNEIRNIEEIEVVRRNRLTELMREEKVMEKLKEKDFNQFKFEINKKENEFIDEIANRRAYKR